MTSPTQKSPAEEQGKLRSVPERKREQKKADFRKAPAGDQNAGAAAAVRTQERVPSAWCPHRSKSALSGSGRISIDKSKTKKESMNMKKTSKALALLLAATMTVGMVFSAVAATYEDSTDASGKTIRTYEDESSISITKVYKLTNPGTTSPAETFTVKQVGDGTVKDGDATSAPALGTITGASYGKGEADTDGVEKEIKITLPDYTKVGVYEYTLKEVEGTTGGVTYSSDTFKLIVTVIEQSGKIRVAAVHTEKNIGTDTKTDKFENTYSASGYDEDVNEGGLKIKKTVTGNMGDTTKYFKVTVTLTGETGKTYDTSGYTVTGGTKINDGDTNETSSTIYVGTPKEMYIKDGETLTIQNVPYGVTYTVVEADYTKKEDGVTKDYDAAKYEVNNSEVTSVTNEEVNEKKESVEITNNKGVEVDTGIVLDSAPYIILAAVAVLGLAMVVLKRRNIEQ